MARAGAVGARFREGTWRDTADQAREHLLGPQLLPLVCSWLVLGVVVALGLFILYMTFVPSLPTEPGFTLKHWAELGSPYVLTKVLPNTLIVGLGTVAVTLLFGGPLAWLLNRTNVPLRNVFITCIAVVIIVPGFVKAMGWIMLVSDRIGLINRAIAGLLGLESLPISLNNPLGMAWVMGLSLTPSLFFLLSGPMRALDPALEDAAATSGASQLRTFLRVSLPLMWPAVLGGAIYNFMTAISMFDVPAVLGAAGGQSPVLSAELFYAVHGTSSETAGGVRYGAAGVYGVLIAAPSLVALYFYHRVLAQAHRYGVITGRGYRPREMDLGKLRYVGLGFVLLYLLLAVVLPTLVLIWASLLPIMQMPSVEALSKLTLRNYDLNRLLASMGGHQVLSNTALLIVAVPLLVVFFSFMTSWIVVRTRVRGRRAMDTIAMLPHAIPGLAFAFALFMASILLAKWVPWLPFAGTMVILVVANLISHLAYGTRITNAALLQVNNELEESARISGANGVATMWLIVAPLVRPSLVFASLWTALLTFREVSMALFLATPQNLVLSVGVWTLWRQGDLSRAAAAAVVLMAIAALLFMLALLLTGGRIGQPRQATPAASAN
jgi:iron(III) transport system permease protein